MYVPNQMWCALVLGAVVLGALACLLLCLVLWYFVL